MKRMKKVLLEEFSYTIDSKAPFKMFYVDRTTRKCDIDNDTNLSSDEKNHLKKLNFLFWP